MKSKAILGLFLAFIALAFAMSLVAANECVGDFVTIDRVEVNDIPVFDGVEYKTRGGFVSDTIPVEVYYTANCDASDVYTEITLRKGHYKFSDESRLNHIVEGSSYAERFTVEFPSSSDIEELVKELSLDVEIGSEEYNTVEDSYRINMQRNQESLNILSVDAPSTVTSGSSFPVDVVVENNGNDRLENVFVRVSIPDLGVQQKVYFGDVDPRDESEVKCDWNDFEDEEDFLECLQTFRDTDEEDTVNKRIYLTLPRSVVPGTYNLEVEAYNHDTSVVAKQKIAVKTVETGVLPTVTTKTVAPGQETTFDVVLVNPADGVAVYTITPKEAPGLIVEPQEPVVAVSGQDSKTVKVKVKATNSAEEGTHVVTLNVNDESGNLVKQVNFSVNVEKGKVLTGFGSRTDAVFILTVVLVIVFVVLLIILIVLLTKKPAEAEEFGETSYY